MKKPIQKNEYEYALDELKAAYCGFISVTAINTNAMQSIVKALEYMSEREKQVQQ